MILVDSAETLKGLLVDGQQRPFVPRAGSRLAHATAARG